MEVRDSKGWVCERFSVCMGTDSEDCLLHVQGCKLISLGVGGACIVEPYGMYYEILMAVDLYL